MKNIIVIILSLIICFSQNFSQENEKIILNLNDIAENKGGRVRKIKRKITKISLVGLYFSTVKLHLFRGWLILYLVGCSPFAEFSVHIAIVIFLFSSLATLISLASALYFESYFIKIANSIYSRCFKIIYGAILLFGFSYIVIGSLAEIMIILKSQIFLNQNQHFILWIATTENFTCYYPRQQQVQEEFNLWLCQSGVEISESDNYYRFTIGNLYWDINKENELDIKAIIILLYTAQHQDQSKRIDGEQLGSIFNCSQTTICRWVDEYIMAGNSLSRALKIPNETGFKIKIRKYALMFWLQDMSKSLLEIEQDLKSINIEANPKQIVEALRNIDFNEVYEHLHKHYHIEKKQNLIDVLGLLEGSEEVQNNKNRNPDKPEVEIKKIGKNLIIKVDNYCWIIEENNKFDYVSLLWHLSKMQSQDGKKMIGLRQLARELGWPHFQALQKLFIKIEILMQGHKDLKAVVQKEGWDKPLIRTKILEIWLEDIFLSAKEVSTRLKQRYNIDISAATIKNTVRDVDFNLVRQQIKKDYSQKKYQKSSQWIMKYYQNKIDNLVELLEQHKIWTPAQIQRYYDDFPTMLIDENPPHTENTKQGYAQKAWFKCFLFGQNRIKNNKVCCPSCGSYDTTLRSENPEPQLIVNPNTNNGEIINKYRFVCNNQSCSRQTFMSTLEETDVLQENKFAKYCTMLRLAFSLNGSYNAIARLLGISKSNVYDSLTFLSIAGQELQKILGIVRFSGTVCIDEKYVKIGEFRKTKKRPFGYAFVAVDPSTSDLLHIEVFPSRGSEAVEAFLIALKIKGIYPQTIMTDRMNAYDKAIKNIFGSQVTICKCLFHFKQNIYQHKDNQFGKNKKDVPKIADELQKEIFHVVDVETKRTLKKRYDALMEKKQEYLGKEPKLESMFDCLKSYMPHLRRMLENPKVWHKTNNAAEQVIRHFNQRYKITAGFKTVETAQRHAKLFELVYRFTPFTDDADSSIRGLCPLEVAGYTVKHMPLYQYLTKPLLFNLNPAQNLQLLNSA